MKKQISAFFLVIAILAGIISASASTQSIGNDLGLAFNGTTATCTSSVAEIGSEIKVTMTLRQGNTQVQSWTKTDYDVVYMSEQCNVSKGKTYTLEVSYTIDGASMPGQSITKTS